MNEPLLPCVEINPREEPMATVIWLHGLGADGHDFESIVPALQLPEILPVRFIFPHAPVRPVSINFGAEMRAWFDIVAIAMNAPQDEKGIRASQKMIHQLINNENRRGIRSDRIIIAGFSQGGAIALQVGLRYPEKLAGILALSTFLPLAGSFPQEASSENKNIPIFMAHGTVDSVVPYQFAKHSCDFLESQGYKVDWHRYPIAHSTCATEVVDIAEWIINVLS